MPLLSRAIFIFICSCYHYFDLCLTSTYFHYFHLLSSIFQFPTLSYDLPNPLPFCLLSSILHLYFDSSLLTSVFHLLSYVPLFCFYYYLSTICPSFLAFPFQPWQLNIPSPVTLWVIFYILHTTPFSVDRNEIVLHGNTKFHFSIYPTESCIDYSWCWKDHWC